MEMKRVDMKMHHEMLHQASKIARARDVTLGQMIRDLLAREISRATHARPPVRADEQRVAPLRARVATDLAEATGWEDLQQRLGHNGYVLRAAGGGLALHHKAGDQRICKASELGFSYSRLMRRFCAPFPGHSHKWLFDRMVNAPDHAPNIGVIEPF
ncbi:hypothetical protein MNBD_ALPHA07-1881 [hydrothermal vent metagenome]|uniref:Uncharacterized protein n=1 Tax=hydrothermal vent metagenome TaxID=652676 RepID=A0A3B0RDB7_9ZZZZ